MRAFQALLVLGGILVIVGIYVVFPASPVSGAEAASIPTGNYYYRIGFSIFKGGHLSGSFAEASGNIVTLYIFDTSQFDSYRTSGVTTSLFETSGANGSFSALLSSPGNYYIVLQHGTAYSGQAQNVQVSYAIDGINPTILFSGIGTIVGGIFVALLGYARKRKTTPPRAVTDVILFDRGRPEGTPPN